MSQPPPPPPLPEIADVRQVFSLAEESSNNDYYSSLSPSSKKSRLESNEYPTAQPRPPTAAAAPNHNHNNNRRNNSHFNSSETKTIEDIRVIQNSVKRGRLNNVGGVVVDIGGGSGGDLRKWNASKVTCVYFVEPNETNLREAQRRHAEMLEQKGRGGGDEHPPPPIVFIHARGEDWETISEVMQRNGHQYADEITMMNSLTFFFLSPKRLDQLVETFRRLLKPSGHIRIVTMTNNGLYEWMGGRYHGCHRSIDGVHCTLHENLSTVCGEQLHVHMDGRKILQNQDEGVVDLEALLERLPEFHLFNLQYCGSAYLQNVQRQQHAAMNVVSNVSYSSNSLSSPPPPPTRAALEWCEMFAAFNLRLGPKQLIGEEWMKCVQQHGDRDSSEQAWLELVKSRVAAILTESRVVRSDKVIQAIASQTDIWEEVFTSDTFDPNCCNQAMETVGDSTLKHGFLRNLRRILDPDDFHQGKMSELVQRELSKSENSMLVRYPEELQMISLIRAHSVFRSDRSLVEDVGEAFLYGLELAAEKCGAMNLEGSSFPLVLEFIRWMMVDHPRLKINLNGCYKSVATSVKEIWEQQLVVKGGRGNRTSPPTSFGLQYTTVQNSKDGLFHVTIRQPRLSSSSETYPCSFLDVVLGVGVGATAHAAKYEADKQAYAKLKVYERGIGFFRQLPPDMLDALFQHVVKQGYRTENLRYERLHSKATDLTILRIYVLTDHPKTTTSTAAAGLKTKKKQYRMVLREYIFDCRMMNQQTALMAIVEEICKVKF
jgi:SAM-dependent methyltransferase